MNNLTAFILGAAIIWIAKALIPECPACPPCQEAAIREQGRAECREYIRLRDKRDAAKAAALAAGEPWPWDPAPLAPTPVRSPEPVKFLGPGTHWVPDGQEVYVTEQGVYFAPPAPPPAEPKWDSSKGRISVERH